MPIFDVGMFATSFHFFRSRFLMIMLRLDKQRVDEGCRRRDIHCDDCPLQLPHTMHIDRQQLDACNAAHHIWNAVLRALCYGRCLSLQALAAQCRTQQSQNGECGSSGVTAISKNGRMYHIRMTSLAFSLGHRAVLPQHIDHELRDQQYDWVENDHVTKSVQNHAPRHTRLIPRRASYHLSDVHLLAAARAPTCTNNDKKSHTTHTDTTASSQ